MGWMDEKKNGNQFKIESYVTLYFSAPEHIVGCFVLKSWISSLLILLDKLLFYFSFSQQMRWTSGHGVMFLREFLVHFGSLILFNTLFKVNVYNSWKN